MVSQPRGKRRRTTTSQLPVWSDELKRLHEPGSSRDDVILPVRCTTEPVESLLVRFAESAGEERRALMAQFVTRGSGATKHLLSVVDAAPIAGPSGLADAALTVLREIHDHDCVGTLVALLARHAKSTGRDSLRSGIVRTLGAFGFDLPEYGLPALWRSSCDEFRANLLEAFALSRIPDPRALELAIAELEDQPIFAAALLGEWGDQRAVDALRNRLNRIDPFTDGEWVDTCWHLTEALLRLGASLSDDEQLLRRRAISARPEGLRSVWNDLVRESDEQMQRHPTSMARILLDHAGDAALPILRRRLEAAQHVARRDLKWATEVIVLVDAIGQLAALEPHETDVLDVARSEVSARLARLSDNRSN